MNPSAIWREDWKRVALRPPFPLRVLRERYLKPRRHYHTFSHALDCLQAVARFAPGDFPHLDVIRLALWFHDAIYDTKRTDNEERSADLAREAIAQASGSAALMADVERLIMATAHAGTSRRRDERLIMDADLSPLADASRIRKLDDAIRREYAWVPIATFSEKRAAVMSRFLKRKRLFSTQEFAPLENAARENVRWIVSRWEGSAGTNENAASVRDSTNGANPVVSDS